MDILTINGLAKAYKSNEHVLKDISLSVKEGEILSIIGPSGSGKTTLLRCATGLETPDKGTISFNGTFSMVFQQFNLFPHWSVLRNITDAPIHNDKRDRTEVMREAMEILERVGLSDRKDAYPDSLSGGEAQRVAIARALMMHPAIIFFDEPTSALDPEMTQYVLRFIRELKDTGIAMVIVTHEMDFARDVSDRIIFMDKGLIADEGSPDEVLNSANPRTKEFLGKLKGERGDL